jgi:hypothetical protein
MNHSVEIGDLIRKNDCDIALFREYVTKLAGKPGTTGYIGDLKRRIGIAERSNTILHAAR